MKVGIIRCMQTEDYCPGTTDFKVIRERKGAFEGITEDIEMQLWRMPCKEICTKGKRACEKRCRYYCICLVYSERYSIRLPMPFRQENENVN